MTNPILSPMIESAAGPSGIRHGFFTREGGVSKGIYEGLNVGVGSDDDQAFVAENRRRVADWFDLPADRLYQPWQVHSPDVSVIDSVDGWGDARPKVDGVVTKVAGIAIGVVTADCGPVLFADAKAGVIGAAHAGWGGAVKGVLESTVETMISVGASRSNIVASLGPSISQENYEVGPEFVDRIVGLSADNAKYFSPSSYEKPEHRLFDLKAYSIDRLEAAGVMAENLGHCTYADEDSFYSYRRTTHRSEPDYGRQLAAISISE